MFYCIGRTIVALHKTKILNRNCRNTLCQTFAAEATEQMAIYKVLLYYLSSCHITTTAAVYYCCYWETKIK